MTPTAGTNIGPGSPGTGSACHGGTSGRPRPPRPAAMLATMFVTVLTRVVARLRVRVLAVIAVGVAVPVVLQLMGPVPSAFAHEELLGSAPSAGSVVAAPLPDISFTFTSRVTPQFVTVTLSVDGQPARQLQTRVDESTVTATPPTDVTSLQQWLVAYRVVSSDGHPVTGQIEFTVTPGATTTNSSASPPQATAGTSHPPGHDAGTRIDAGQSPVWAILGIGATVTILTIGGAIALVRSRRPAAETRSRSP